MKTINDVKNAYLEMLEDACEKFKSSIRVIEYEKSIQFISSNKEYIDYLWIKLAMFQGGNFDSYTGKQMGGTDYYLSMTENSSYNRHIAWLKAQAAREI